MSSRNDAATLLLIQRFFGMAAGDAEKLRAQFESCFVAGGDWLMRQGDVADSIYFLIRGRLQVWIADDTADSAADPKLVGEITAGESIGEIGLLTGGKRTASIRAIRDSQLLRLSRQDFERFAVDHPELVMQLAGGIANRLIQRTKPSAAGARLLKTIALLPLLDAPWLDGFYKRLAEELATNCSLLCLSAANLAESGAPISTVDGLQSFPPQLTNWLDEQESRHDLIMYIADAADSPWSQLCTRQAEGIFLVADAHGDPHPGAWEQKLLGSRGAAIAKRALLLRHDASSKAIEHTARWLEGRDLGFHLHVRDSHPADIARVARIMSGKSIGLVLGAGAARGFAEIGAYRALCDAGVPIDWVGGSSIGGIIGAAIASDRGPDFVLNTSRDAFVRGKPFSDYTVPVLSVIRGRRMEALIREHLDGNIEDLPIPFFCVSTLLDSGELQVHEEGSIWRALRATAAMPGLLPPAVFRERLVIDGAVLNNLPVDIMQLKPVARIIAVSVAHSAQARLVNYDDLPSPWSVLRGRLFPFMRRYRVPGLISIMLKTSEIGTAARMREVRNRANLLLTPPVGKFSLTDVRAFDQIVKVGYDDAQQRLKEWLDQERC